MTLVYALICICIVLVLFNTFLIYTIYSFVNRNWEKLIQIHGEVKGWWRYVPSDHHRHKT